MHSSQKTDSGSSRSPEFQYQIPPPSPVLDATANNNPALATRDIAAALLTCFTDITAEAHRRAVTAAEADDSKVATLETSRPTRKTLGLPLTRPLNL